MATLSEIACVRVGFFSNKWKVFLNVLVKNLAFPKNTTYGSQVEIRWTNLSFILDRTILTFRAVSSREAARAARRTGARCFATDFVLVVTITGVAAILAVPIMRAVCQRYDKHFSAYSLYCAEVFVCIIWMYVLYMYLYIFMFILSFYIILSEHE